MPLGPIVAGAVLAEDEVVRTEEFAVRTVANGVHRAGLEVHQHRARHVAPTCKEGVGESKWKSRGFHGKTESLRDLHTALSLIEAPGFILGCPESNGTLMRGVQKVLGLRYLKLSVTI